MKRVLCTVICLLMLLSLVPVSADAAVLGVHPERYLHSQLHDADCIELGIDISEYQGEIDWQAVAASEVSFAFLRIGGRYSGSGLFYDDTYFDENFAGATANGIPVGVYFFSQAVTTAEAEEEAKHVIEQLGSRAGQLRLPVMLDMEYVSGSGRVHAADLSETQAADIALAFCDAIAAAGLQAGIYTSLGSYPVDADAVCDAGYYLWHADWTDETPYDGWFDFWQISDSGTVPGIEGSVDINFRYIPPRPGAAQIETLYLSDPALTLTAGTTAPLAVAFSPAAAADRARWHAADPTIACVDPVRGTVTAVRPGTTDIIASTAGGISAVCRVTVEPSDTTDTRLVIASAAPLPFLRGAAETEVVVCTADALSGGQATVCANPAKLRRWPSVQYAPIAQLPYGSSVSILAAVFDQAGTLWCAVASELNGETVRGFVRKADLCAVTGVTALQPELDYTLTFTGTDAPGTAHVTAVAAGDACSGTDTASFLCYDWQLLSSRNRADALVGRMGSAIVSGSLADTPVYAWAAKDEQFVTLGRRTDSGQTMLRNNRLYTQQGDETSVSVFADAADFGTRFAQENAALIAAPIAGEEIVSVSQRDGILTVTTHCTPPDSSDWAVLTGSGSTLTRVWTVDEATLQITACSAASVSADGQSTQLGRLSVSFGTQPDGWVDAFALIHPDLTRAYTVVRDPGTDAESETTVYIDRDAVFRYLPSAALSGPFADRAGTQPADGQQTQYVFSAAAFDDVTPDSWYYDSVRWAAARGLLRGVSETQFAPEQIVTREMLITVLYRMSGQPTPGSTTDFADVSADAWYHDAVCWAVENNLSNGSGDGLFGAGQALTREQMAVLLYRYAGAAAAAPSGDMPVFADSGAVSDWAADAMDWAVSQQLISGSDDGLLSPQLPCTRAQAAVILQRYLHL